MKEKRSVVKSSRKDTASLSAMSRRVAAAFFDVQETDSRSEVGKKAVRTTSDRTLYAAIDWSMDFVETAGIIALYAYGYGPILIAALAWIFELICAGFFLVLWYRYKRDLPLAKNSRRAVDQLKKESVLAGNLAAAGNMIIAFFWEGPEKIIIHYEERFDSNLKIILALVILAASHAIFMTLVSIFAVEAVIGIVDTLF